MSILGDAVVIGSGGETATIVLTVPHGATAVSCTTPAGVVLIGVCVEGASTDVYTFARLRSYGSYVCSATKNDVTKTLTVVVDAAETYSVSIEFGLYLYNEGDECTAVTGGWSFTKESGSNGTLTKNTDNMTMRSTDAYACYILTANSIDTTDYTTLHILFDLSMTTSTNAQCNLQFVGNSSTWGYATGTRTSVSYTNKLDEKPINGSGAVKIRFNVANTSVTRNFVLKKLWLE